MKTSGHTLLITGAGTGMGLAAAKAFSARGNRVVMVARDGAAAERGGGARRRRSLRLRHRRR